MGIAKHMILWYNILKQSVLRSLVMRLAVFRQKKRVHIEISTIHTNLCERGIKRGIGAYCGIIQYDEMP